MLAAGPPSGPTSSAPSHTIDGAPHAGQYRGRFAPTPSGPLHFGSLVAAVGSFLDARANHGTWLVRIEDLDPPRVKPGAADEILRALDEFGLHWDGPVMRQSERAAAYAAAIGRLARQRVLRECPCSRAVLAALPENQSHPPAAGDELFHPRECVAPAAGSTPAPGYALRLRVPPGSVSFEDRSLGPQSIDVARTVGDFVLRRRDGLYAYQLAVVVDDAEQGITDIVRGCDLLASTARQVLLQRALCLPTPRYLHLPLAVDDRGFKLSKSEAAPAVGAHEPSRQLVAVLRFLGQAPPGEMERAQTGEFLAWAIAHWRLDGFAGRVSGTVAEQGANAGLAG
jgi:glutamyl-Q tRNA(Asp) synthetase